MNIAGALLNGLENEQVDQIDQRGLLRHAVHVVGLNGVKILLHLIRALAVAGQTFSHARRGHAIRLPHQLTESFGRHTNAFDGHVGNGARFVNSVKIKWIRHGGAQVARRN